MIKTFKYRLYPTKHQQRLLDEQLEECRWLYNYLLAERRDAWEQRQTSLSYYDQAISLPKLKMEHPTLLRVHSQALQNVARRLELAFKMYFQRVKSGETPGFPRFRGKGRYNSMTFPQVPTGCSIEGERKQLRITNVGHIKLFLHRPLEGTPKTASVTRSSTGKWYVCFTSECAEPAPLPCTGQQVGIDVGLNTFAALSTGDAIANPHFFRNEELALKKAQRRLDSEELGSPGRVKQRRIVARIHERVAWRRDDFAHQHSRHIVNDFDVIAVEALAITRMIHLRSLAKSIHDAAWGQFASYLSCKAAWAGRKYIAVNPAHTSQDCSRCGYRQKLALADRVYTCPRCGLALDRDLNASLNILSVGQHALASA